MTNRKLRYSGLGLAVLTVGALAACSSDPTNPVGAAGSGTGGTGAAGGPAAGGPGTAGSSTAGGGTGGTGTAGSGGSGGGSAGFACVGTKPTAALITDFSNLVANATSAGNYTFAGGVLGGTFSYQANALTLDTVSNTVLNVKGNIKAYDGFGLYFNTCYDASAYTGISFSVKGNAGPKAKLNFRVQTNTNTAIDVTNMKGQCVASNPADTYPDCHASAFDVPVTAAGTVVTVLWSQLTGGVPTAAVTGNNIVGLEWAFDWTPGPAAGGAGGGGAGGASAGSGGASAGSGGASAGSGGKGGAGGASGGTGGASAGSGGAPAAAGPYDADVTIDDVKFIGGPPEGGAGGGGGSGGASAGAGGASAGSGGASAGTGGSSAGSGGKAGGN